MRNRLNQSEELKEFLEEVPIQLNLHQRIPSREGFRNDTIRPMKAFRLAQLLSNEACVVMAKEGSCWVPVEPALAQKVLHEPLPERADPRSGFWMR